MDQEFVVETDTTVNNTGKDIMGEQASIPFLSQITRSLWLLLIQKITVLLKIIFHPWKDFRLAARSALQMESLGGYAYILKQFHNVIPEAELQDNILKYNPIASNVPPKYSGSYGKNLAENWRLYTV